MNPSARTLARLRKLGMPCGKVERWVGPVKAFGGVGNRRFGKRVDLFGFIDIIALDGESGCLGVQCCAASGISSHVAKIRIDCNVNAREWLRRGNRIQVWGWSKRGEKGKRKLWQPRIVDVTLGEFQGQETIDVPRVPGSGLAAFAKDVAKQKRKRTRKPKPAQQVLAL